MQRGYSQEQMLKTKGDCSFTRLDAEASKGVACQNANTNFSFIFVESKKLLRLGLCASTEKTVFSVPEALGPAQ